jgi:transcriptional regulator with XRE-family HTH domain
MTYGMPPLTTEELKKRIHAARILRGLKQTELQDRLHEAGLRKLELGRIERGQLPLTRVRRQALIDALHVPERWFLSEDVDEVVGYRAIPLPPVVEEAMPPGALGRNATGSPPTESNPRPAQNPPGGDTLQGAC